MRLSTKPEAIRGLSLYRAKVQALVDLGLRFEACALSDLTKTGFGLQEKYGLSTNDAVVLAVAIRLKADVLVSSDKDLRFVTELVVHYPTVQTMNGYEQSHGFASTRRFLRGYPRHPWGMTGPGQTALRFIVKVGAASYPYRIRQKKE